MVDPEIFILTSVLVTVFAYLLGSIPTAVIIGKYFYGIDVREFGSGNAGATNTIRVLGPKAGIFVFAIDILKGFAAVELAYIMSHMALITTPNYFALFKVIISFFVIIGHVFPVLAGFRGGKGIATTFGAVMAMLTLPALVSLGVFIIVYLLSKYISLGSIVASFVFPFVCIFVFKNKEYAYVIYSIAIAVFIPFTHRKNIYRILKGQEAKFFFRKKTPLAR